MAVDLPVPRDYTLLAELLCLMDQGGRQPLSVPSVPSSDCPPPLGLPAGTGAWVEDAGCVGRTRASQSHSWTGSPGAEPWRDRRRDSWGWREPCVPHPDSGRHMQDSPGRRRHPRACCPVLRRGLTAAPGRNSRPVSIHRPLCVSAVPPWEAPPGFHTSAACTQRGPVPAGGTLFPQPCAGADGTRRRACVGRTEGPESPTSCWVPRASSLPWKPSMCTPWH